MTTLVVYADTVDGDINSQDGWPGYPGVDGVYALARAGTGDVLAVQDGSNDLVVGQMKTLQGGDTGDPDYNPYDYTVFDLYEAFVSFDTSSVGAGSSVSSAVLNVVVTSDASYTDFTMQARLRDWGSTLEAADFVPGASLTGLTLLAHLDTAGALLALNHYDFADDAMPANVNKTGSTRMALCSSRMATGTAPTGTEAVQMYPADRVGTTSDPRLTVTYSAGGPAEPGLKAVLMKAV